MVAATLQGATAASGREPGVARRAGTVEVMPTGNGAWLHALFLSDKAYRCATAIEALESHGLQASSQVIKSTLTKGALSIRIDAFSGCRLTWRASQGYD